MIIRIATWLCISLTVFSTYASQAKEVNIPVPSCVLIPLEGGQPYNIQQFKGKVVYVDFWASWCSSCAKSFPFLNTLQDASKGKDLQIIGVNLDEDITPAKKFIAQYPPQFSVAADASKQCAKEFGVEAMPSTYLIDKKGIIRYVHLGFREGETQDIQQKLEQLMLEK